MASQCRHSEKQWVTVRWTDAYNGPCEGVVAAPGGDPRDYIEAKQIVVYIPSEKRRVVADIHHFQKPPERPSHDETSPIHSKGSRAIITEQAIGPGCRRLGALRTTPKAAAEGGRRP